MVSCQIFLFITFSFKVTILFRIFFSVVLQYFFLLLCIVVSSKNVQYPALCFFSFFSILILPLCLTFIVSPLITGSGYSFKLWNELELNEFRVLLGTLISVLQDINFGRDLNPESYFWHAVTGFLSSGFTFFLLSIFVVFIIACLFYFWCALVVFYLYLRKKTCICTNFEGELFLKIKTVMI